MVKWRNTWKSVLTVHIMWGKCNEFKRVKIKANYHKQVSIN